MNRKIQFIFLSICALSLNTDAVEYDLETMPSNENGNTMAEKTMEEYVPLADLGHSVDKNGQSVDTIVQQDAADVVEQPSTPMIVEHAAASTSAENLESDPKSQRDELLEMNDTFIWEMSVRSEIEQSIDPEDDLKSFPKLIFKKLEMFLQNVPDGEAAVEQKAELSKLVDNWKTAEADANHFQIQLGDEAVQIQEIVDSLDSFSEQLRERYLSSVRISPAILDTLLSAEHVFDENHEKQRMDFLWKMVIRKQMRQVKNVGQFFGRLEIALAYLRRALLIGDLMNMKKLITPEQWEDMKQIFKRNVLDLMNLKQKMAARLSIDLNKVGVPELMAQTMPSIEDLFALDRPNPFMQIKGIAQIEKTQINEAQIGTALMITALSAASVEVQSLLDELWGIKINWRAFQTVGELNKVTNVLLQPIAV